MKTETQALFTDVFRGAHVVDVDFSRWDKFIRLVVVGSTPSTRGDRLEMFNVDFARVSELHLVSNHLGIQLPTDEHCQWTVHDSELTNSDKGWLARLLCIGGPEPLFEVWCADINITSISAELIDLVNPKWNEPSRPLARPSLEELAALVVHGRSTH